MTLEQAERLKANEDFQAFIALLNSDCDSIKEDMVYQQPEEILKDQLRVQTIRGVSKRLDHVIESARPEEPAVKPSASGQSTV
jgi:hypothetical protein